MVIAFLLHLRQPLFKGILQLHSLPLLRSPPGLLGLQLLLGIPPLPLLGFPLPLLGFPLTPLSLPLVVLVSRHCHRTSKEEP